MTVQAAHSSTLLDAALTYASRGWPVFPVHTPMNGQCSCGNPQCEKNAGKHPRGNFAPNGLHDATTDPATIREWWQAEPDANIGIRTGAVSGLVVLDIDPIKGGDESLTGLERRFGSLPPTVEGLSGGGGRHILFSYPGDGLMIPNSVAVLAPGLDIRADGGYIVAPPSLHRSGRQYAWEVTACPEDVPLAPLPTWLLDLITKPKASGYGLTERFDTAKALAGVPEGQRDDTIFRFACKLRHSDVPQDMAERLILEAAANCAPPFPEAKAREKVRYAYARYESGSRTQSGTGTVAAGANGVKVRLIAASTIQPEPVTWAFRQLIPLGALTIIAGNPGLGKSTIALEVAARLSLGEAEGDLKGQPVSIVIASAEDSPATTLVPRLTTAGADLDSVHFTQVELNGFVGSLALPEHLDALTEQMKEVQARILIIDPLMAHLPGKINSWRDQDIRCALAPLARLAEELDAAVIAIAHLNKSETSEALVRVGGSIGIVAAARSVLLAVPDPENPEGRDRVLGQVKSNLGPRANPLRYYIESRTIQDRIAGAIETCGVVWNGEAPNLNPDELLVRYDQEERTRLDEAKEWLREALDKADRPVDELVREARKAGHSEPTLRRAKVALRVKSTKKEFSGKWCWTLPNSAEGAQRPSKDDQYPNDDHLRGSSEKNSNFTAQLAEDDQTPDIDHLRKPDDHLRAAATERKELNLVD